MEAGKGTHNEGEKEESICAWCQGEINTKKVLKITQSNSGNGDSMILCDLQQVMLELRNLLKGA
jgi:hypothetical protein